MVLHLGVLGSDHRNTHVYIKKILKKSSSLEPLGSDA